MFDRGTIRLRVIELKKCEVPVLSTYGNNPKYWPGGTLRKHIWFSIETFAGPQSEDPGHSRQACDSLPHGQCYSVSFHLPKAFEQDQRLVQQRLPSV